MPWPKSCQEKQPEPISRCLSVSDSLAREIAVLPPQIADGWRQKGRLRVLPEPNSLDCVSSSEARCLAKSGGASGKTDSLLADRQPAQPLANPN